MADRARSGWTHGPGRVARHPLTWITAAWVAANLVWLWAYRRSRTFELDEAGYTALAVRMARQRSLGGFASALKEGVHGPLQALLALPAMWLTGSDPAVLILENIGFAAVTAVLTYVAGSHIGGRRPALVAAVVVLASPGMVEFSHFGLTVMPAVMFATLALVAVARGNGLEDWRWAVVAGAAVGCMTLSRSMTIGFLPAYAVMAAGWAWSRRTPLSTVVRNGVAAAATAGLVAAWWWLLRWGDVSTYLFGGGSSDTTQLHDPILKAELHGRELFYSYLGTTTLIAAVGGLVIIFLLRRGEMEGSVLSITGQERRLAVWPLWAATATMLGVLSIGGAFGLGFVLPALPWVTVAGAVGVSRLVDRREFVLWMAAVVLFAVATTVDSVDPGLTADSFCGGEATQQKSMCLVDSEAVGEDWRAAVDEVAERIDALQEASPEGDGLSVALLSKDFLVNANTLGLAAEVRRGKGIAWNAAFDPTLPESAQVDRAVTSADVVVTTDDFSDPPILGTGQPTPGSVEAAARVAGFQDCDVVTLPDSRTVSILIAPTVPSGGCR